MNELVNSLNLLGKQVALGYRGSYAYGTRNELTKDIDLFHIYVLSESHYLGLNEQKVSDQIFSGEYDIATFELKKWCRLIAKQSPSVLEQLFTDYYLVNELRPLLECRHRFLSKKIFNPFTKYAMSLGDDNKSKAHSYRLLAMCYEALISGNLNVYRGDNDVEMILDIRAGKFNPEKVIMGLLSKCELALLETALPEEPDLGLLNEICVSLIKRHLKDDKELNDREIGRGMQTIRS